MTASPLPSYNSVIASARVIEPKRRLSPKYETWQDQVWDFYDRIGELEYGIGWMANTLSRIRLTAAELSPGGDEPVPIETGAAADAVNRLAGGTGGQAQLMKEFGVHLGVPGECWLVGEVTLDDTEAQLEGEGDEARFMLTGEEQWSVKSADEIRVASRRVNGKPTYEVREDDSKTSWRLISPESLVIRIWDPHPRFGWKADSAARHSLGVLTELDLVNKRIIATIASRLAQNGILLYDKGKLSIRQKPPGPEGAGGEENDPFAEMLVEVASRAIKDPMSPEALIPIPVGFDISEMADVNPALLMQVISFANPVDEKLTQERDSAIRRLATSLDMPAEVLLGLGDVNHWSAWQIEESGMKVHIAPKAELICYSLTTGFLVPMLRAMNAPLVGPNGGRIVVWYDPSEVTVRPDKSENTVRAYDRHEVSGEALRRELGLDEDDAPDDAQLREQILKGMSRNPAYAAAAITALEGGELVTPVIDETGRISTPGDEDTPGIDGPPDTIDEGPPPPGEDLPEFNARVNKVMAELGPHNGRAPVG